MRRQLEHYRGRHRRAATSSATRRLVLRLVSLLLVCQATACGSSPSAQSWHFVSVPAGATRSWLESAACPAVNDCWAVGVQGSGSEERTLIEHFDGTRWSIVSSPDNPIGTNKLTGVSCPSLSACWAVGEVDKIAGTQVLIENFDGHGWTLVPTPNTDLQSPSLEKVACPSASDCWAVGLYDSAASTGAPSGLIDHYDGQAWTSVTRPMTSSIERLTGVSCSRIDDCWAVGGSLGNGAQTLLDHLKGSQWTDDSAAPDSATTDYRVFNVTCANPVECEAVGTDDASPSNQSGYSRTLIYRFNGSAWTRVASPNTSASESNYLFGVTCTSVQRCWAVGNTCSCTNAPYATGATHGLIAVSDGRDSPWALATTPRSGGKGDYLLDIACPTPSQCWAVGGTGEHPLVMHYGN